MAFTIKQFSWVNKYMMYYSVMIFTIKQFSMVNKYIMY